MSDEGDEEEEGAREVGPVTATRMVGVGLALAIVACYLPWFGYPSGGPPFGFSVSGYAYTGFSGWGIGFFIAWLAATIIFLALYVFPDALANSEMPVEEWFIFAALGVLMVLFALTVPADIGFLGGFGEGSNSGLRFGWWLAIIAAVLVAAGGWAMRPEVGPAPPHDA